MSDETQIQDQAAAADEQADTPAKPRELGDKEKLVIRMLGDIARLDNQVQFISRRAQSHTEEVEDRLSYLENTLGVLFEHLGIEKPQRLPRLIDAQVELIEDDQKIDGEILEFQGAYSATPHPILGHIQLIIGIGEDSKLTNHKSMHPIVAKRIEEAFAAKLQSAPGLTDGKFYWIRLGLIHAEPINADSRLIDVPAPVAAEEPAAT